MTQVTSSQETTTPAPAAQVIDMTLPQGSSPKSSEAVSDALTTTGISHPEFLTDKDIEADYENVQRTVRSMKEYCAEITSRNERAVQLAWDNITVTTLDGSKTLLTGASGVVHSRFLAIMGPSGSGKTTLMNVLARRMTNAKMDGKAQLNGVVYGNAELKAVSGYVMQDDLLNGNLTVQETLDYTAALRLPETMTAAERKARVDEAILKVGLDHVRHVIIGSPMKKGVSGGERKRVCVAMELLTHPRLLFLDEPTSGLDSVTALSLTEILKKLADSGECTVVCTIHQPQTKIFELFDDLMLLKAGRIVYYGQAAKACDFFAEAGFPCPIRTNPADHFLDVITPQPGQKAVSSPSLPHLFHSEADKRLATVFRPVDEKVENDYERYGDHMLVHERPSWFHQFKVLTQRCMVDNFRSWPVILTLMVQNIVMALLIGGAFYQIGLSQSSQVRRQPVLFFVVINQGIFAALSVINSFPSERLLVLRERAAGTYQVSAYFCAKNLADLILQLPGPIVFSAIVYFMVGFQPVASKFFIFVGLMILDSLAAISMALMVSALARTTTLSVTVLPMILEVSRLFGGFFLSPANVPRYFVWLDALSYVKYAYVGTALNELEGLTLECEAGKPCPYPTGQTVIEQLGLNQLSIGACVGALFALIVGFRVIAYFGIRYIKW